MDNSLQVEDLTGESEEGGAPRGGGAKAYDSRGCAWYFRFTLC